MDVRDNQAYRLRLQCTGKLLGKTLGGTKEDGDDGVDVVDNKKNIDPEMIREQVAQLQYKALVSEGATLYRAQEYRRAIDAFTQAMEAQKDDPNVLIDRANCYIQIGQPEDGLKDIDTVLKEQPNNPRAILTKAEAYFSMGEFEFALVFFQRGKSIRKDISAFRDGITKCKSAILDSINGENLFQANPNYAVSRPRKALIEVKERDIDNTIDDEKLQQRAKLLPEPVQPLATTQNENKNYLGELTLDYDYLEELREEVTNSPSDDNYGKKEDEQIAKIVDEAMIYLNQRGAFWCQQGANKDKGDEEENTSATQSPTKTRSSTTKSPKSKTAKSKQAHYEMSKIQQYESKYGATAPSQEEAA